MRGKYLRNFSIFVVLVVMSGFFFCPHMRQIAGIDLTHSALAPDQDVGHFEEQDVEPQLIKRQEAASARVQKSYREGNFPEHVSFKKVNDEELKSHDYRAYIFKKYADAEGEAFKSYPSSEESREWLRENLGPELLKQLEAQKAP